MTLPVAGLGSIQLSFGQESPVETFKQPKLIDNGMLPETDSAPPIVEDNTHTAHRTWKSQAGAHMEPLPLHFSVFGAGRYSAGCQKRIITTNLATKAFTYHLSCLQDLLGPWWYSTCASNQPMCDLT